jgi:hypothetical protein
MLMHHHTGASTTNMTNPYANLNLSSIDWANLDLPRPATSTSINTENLAESLSKFNKPTKPSVVYVEKEVPAETPWLLILLAVAAAYYMGKKK